MSDPYNFLKDRGLSKVVVPEEAEPKARPQKKESAAKRVLSPEMKENLEALAGAMQDQAMAEEIEEETDLASGSVVDEPIKVDLGETPEEFSGVFDTVFYRNTPIDNKEVRKEIELKCKPLEFSDLILEGSVKQTVELIPDKLVVLYRSLRARDNIWIERQASGFTDEFEARSWIGYARLVASVDSINGELLPEQYDSDGKLCVDLFSVKVDKILSLPERLIEILLVNLSWFDDRVGQLFYNDYEKLKNG